MSCHVPDAANARQASELQLFLRRRRRQLATVDALSAVSALRYDLTLLSTDNDFDPVPNLQAFDCTPGDLLVYLGGQQGEG